MQVSRRIWSAEIALSVQKQVATFPYSEAIDLWQVLNNLKKTFYMNLLMESS